MMSTPSESSQKEHLLHASIQETTTALDSLFASQQPSINPERINYGHVSIILPGLTGVEDLSLSADAWTSRIALLTPAVFDGQNYGSCEVVKIRTVLHAPSQIRFPEEQRHWKEAPTYSLTIPADGIAACQVSFLTPQNPDLDILGVVNAAVRYGQEGKRLATILTAASTLRLINEAMKQFPHVIDKRVLATMEAAPEVDADTIEEEKAIEQAWIRRVGSIAQSLGFEHRYMQDREVAQENLTAMRDELNDDPNAYDPEDIKAAEQWYEQHYWFRYFKSPKLE